MSWRATAYIKAMKIAPNGEPLTRSEKLVAYAVADSHQDRGADSHTFPSVEALAEDSLMTKRECQRILASLEQKAVIVRLRPAVQFRGMTTFYSFPNLDAVRVTPKPPLPRKKDGSLATLKGGATDTLKGDGRVTEGCRKGDILPPVYKEEQEQEQKNANAPSESSADSFSLVQKKHKAARAKADPRWTSFLGKLSDYWREHHGPEFPFPFSDADGRQLKNFLAANPHLGVDQFAKLIKNRSGSRVCHSDPPHKWLNGAIRYAGGALNEYGQPLQQGNTTQAAGERKVYDNVDDRLAALGAPRGAA